MNKQKQYQYAAMTLFALTAVFVSVYQLSSSDTVDTRAIIAAASSSSSVSSSSSSAARYGCPLYPIGSGPEAGGVPISPDIIVHTEVPKLTNQPVLNVQYSAANTEYVESFNLTEGENTITISQPGFADWSTVVVLDTQPPVLSVADSELYQHFSVSDGDVMALIVSPGELTTFSYLVDDAASDFNVPTEAGPHELTISRTDAAGNAASLVVRVIENTVMPEYNLITDIPPTTRSGYFTLYYEIDGTRQFKEFTLRNGQNTMTVSARNQYYQGVDLKYTIELQGNGVPACPVDSPTTITQIQQRIAADVSTSLDARLEAHRSDVETALKMFTVYDEPNGVYERNPDSWFSDIDLTGVSNDKVGGATCKQGTLISPRHVATNKHCGVNTNDLVTWVTQDGTPVQIKVIGRRHLTNDASLAYLESDAPESLKKYKVLPPDWKVYFSQSSPRIPFLMLNQDEKGYVRDITSLSTFFAHTSPFSTLRQLFTRGLRSGDSAHPDFLLIDGEPVLMSTHQTTGGGPFWGGLSDTVNIGMEAMDRDNTGYQLEYYDLESYAAQFCD